MEIHWLKDYKELSKIAADNICNTIRNSNITNLALPTGFTPIGMYHELIKRKLDWSQVRTFNLDEYLDLPSGHRGSFQHYMDYYFHWHVEVKEKYFPSLDYDKVINDLGDLDLTILGLGNNGHIAFNEPGSTIDTKTRIVNLANETCDQNRKNWGFDSPFPSRAITMGISTILSSKKIILLVCGEKKLSVLKRAIWSDITPAVPASFLQTHKNFTVYYCD